MGIEGAVAREPMEPARKGKKRAIMIFEALFIYLLFIVSFVVQ